MATKSKVVKGKQAASSPAKKARSRAEKGCCGAPLEVCWRLGCVGQWVRFIEQRGRCIGQRGRCIEQ